MEHPSGCALHVVARFPRRLARVLAVALPSHVALRLWRTWPPRASLDTWDTLLVDLGDLPADARAEGHPSWLVLLRRWDAEVIRCDGAARAGGFGPLLALAYARYRRLCPAEIARLVLAAEPCLDPLADLVRLICAHPWEIRRPCDLAGSARQPMGWVKRACAGLGFARVEHLIVLVRAVAYEQLAARLHLAPAMARRLSGFDDPSNLRRHVRRALERSPAVRAWVRSLSLP